MFVLYFMTAITSQGIDSNFQVLYSRSLMNETDSSDYEIGEIMKLSRVRYRCFPVLI